MIPWLYHEYGTIALAILETLAATAANQQEQASITARTASRQA